MRLRVAVCKSDGCRISKLADSALYIILIFLVRTRRCPGFGCGIGHIDLSRGMHVVPHGYHGESDFNDRGARGKDEGCRRAGGRFERRGFALSQRWIYLG